MPPDTLNGECVIRRAWTWVSGRMMKGECEIRSQTYARRELH